MLRIQNSPHAELDRIFLDFTDQNAVIVGDSTHCVEVVLHSVANQVVVFLEEPCGTNNKNYGIHISHFVPRLGAHGTSNLSTSGKTE